MSALTWGDLAYSLATHLAAMPPGTYFILYVDESGSPGFDPDFDDHPRYVQFCSYEGETPHDGVVRCEVVSNTYLPETMRHSVDDLVTLREIGWTMPEDELINGSPNIFVDVLQPDTDDAAWMVMCAFTEVWKLETPDGVITDAEHLRGAHAFRMLDAPAGYLTADPVH